MTVHIKGQRVILRDITPQDIDTLYYWNYSAEDREHQNWDSPYTIRPPYTRDEYAMNELADHLTRAHTDQPRRKLLVEIDGEVRGIVAWYWVSEKTNWFEIGIVLYDSRYWSGGYGTEAFGMWMDYLFTHIDTPRLGIGTWSGNERMIRLAQKLGMIEEARVRKARIVRGEYYDAIKMGILREEWESRKVER